MTGADQLARSERSRLGLGETAPIVDLLRVLEFGAGVQVALCQLGEQGLAGMYQLRDGVAVILVNSSNHPVRERFTLAHEYGHHCLGHGAAVDRVIDPGSRERREVDANRFAAELLLPRLGIEWWLQASGDAAIDLETVVRLANEYGVSCDVVLHRLEVARRVRPALKRSLRACIDAGDHRTLAWQLRLPELADTLARERRLPLRMPGPTRRTVLRALERGLIDVRAAAQRLHVDEREIARLRRLEPAID